MKKDYDLSMIGEILGGLGELQTDLLVGNTHRASDTNMVRRAMNENWHIAPEKRPKVVDRLLKNVKDGDIDQSTKAAAVLVNMTKVNQADLHHVENLNAPKTPPVQNLGPTIMLVGGCWGKMLAAATKEL